MMNLVSEFDQAKSLQIRVHWLGQGPACTWWKEKSNIFLLFLLRKAVNLAT